MQQNYIGARYGIWGEPTAPERMGPMVDPLQQAMGTANGIQTLFGNYYKNKMAGIDTGIKQNDLDYSNQTLGSSIGAANTKNQADMQYYPLMQQAKLQQDQQNVKEIMARTGLDYANAKMALAHIPLLQAETSRANASANPGFAYDSLQKAMDSSPAGSPRKAYFAGLMSTMMGQAGGGIPITQGGKGSKSSPLMMPGMGGGSKSSQGGSSVPNMPGLTVNPMTVSRSSNKGAEYAQTDPQGNTTVYTSPTTPTVTGLQNRLSAESELHSLSPTIDSGIAPYISTYGANVSYPMDLYKASNGNKEAQKRVDDAESAMQLVREKAILRIRQASPNAEIGQESVNSMVKQMYPNMPAHFLRGFNNAQSISESTRKVDEQLANANQVAAQAVASNYPTPVNENPVWDRNGQVSSSMGRFDPYSGQYIPPQPQQAPSMQQMPQQSQDMQGSRVLNGREYVKINGKWHTK